MANQDPEAKTLDSIGDSLFEARFDPEQKRKFAAQLDAAASPAPNTPYSIPLQFCSNFDSKTTQALQNVISGCLQAAKACELSFYCNAEVEFYGPQDWEKKSNNPDMLHQLPAAQAENSGSVAKIQIICPLKISTADGVIKAVRLLCSKLFGDLFFNEKIANRAPFAKLAHPALDLSFDFTEKLHFIWFLERFPTKLLQAFDQEARQQGFRGPKAHEMGKKSVFRSLVESSETHPQWVNWIAHLFQQELEQLNLDPNAYFDTLLQHIEPLLPRGGLVLPHEKKQLDFFKAKKQWNQFFLLEERLQFITSYVAELEEATNWLESTSVADGEFDPDLAYLWKKALRERNLQMIKRGWVKLFLIDDAKLNDKQRGKKQRFPLWLWQQGLLDHLPQGTTAEKKVQKLCALYQQSVYSKLYEWGYRLEQKVAQLEKKQPRNHQDGAPRIKGLQASLSLLSQSFTPLLNAVRIASQFADSSTATPSQAAILEAYRQGWSYFISFALIHQFYLEQSGSNAKKFIDAIESYSLKQIQDEPSYQISTLLLKLYQKKNFDLKLVVQLITQHNKIIDFYVLNLAALIHKPNQSTQDLISSYADLIDERI